MSSRQDKMVSTMSQGQDSMKSLKEKWDSVEWRTGGKTGQADEAEESRKWVSKLKTRENQFANEHATQGRWRSCKHSPQVKLPIESHRQTILDHVRRHRITFIQGDPGCGKSTSVPQFILDDHPSGRINSQLQVRVLVTQPRRLAAISLAQRVAKLRNQKVGAEVGYCVGQDHQTSGENTRLFYMTSGYLLDWLGFQWNKDRPLRECMTHLILDEVHESSREHDLLLLMLKKLLLKDEASSDRPWGSDGYPKIIIMSATLQAKPFRDYFAAISHDNSGGSSSQDTLSVGVPRFPVDIVFLEEIEQAIPTLDKTAKELLQRLLKHPARGNCFPGFAFPLVVHLVKNTAQVGDVVLVFVPGLIDIVQLQEAFKLQPGGDVKFETFLLHSILDKDEQAEVFRLPSPGSSKVVIATSIAESSITIPGVRFVIDLGMTKTMEYDRELGIERLTCSWCTQASATQRAGRVGRLSPGTVLRLFTKKTHGRFRDFLSSSNRQRNVEYELLKLKSAFSVFGSANQLIREIMEPPEPKLVRAAISALVNMGALVYSQNGAYDVLQLTPLGRLAMRISADLQVAKLVMLGLVMKCSPDCIVMGAALQTDKHDMFNQQMYQNQREPLRCQKQLLECFKSRKKFDDGQYSEMTMYRQVYIEGQRHQFSRRWMEQNCISYYRFHLFLLTIKKYARATIDFLLEHKLSEAMQIEHCKLDSLARHGNWRPDYMGNPQTIFHPNLNIVKLAITAAFAGHVIIGRTATSKRAVNEAQELERAGLPPSSSIILKGVDAKPVDLEKIRRVLKVIEPAMKIEPSSLDRSAALIQCPETGCRIRSVEPVIRDLPESGLSLFHLPRLLLAKGTMIVQFPGPEGCTEEHIGRPSKCRQITWSTTLNGQVQKVKCEQNGVLEPAFETRSSEEISFHLGVAHHFLGTKMTSSVTAHFVTILPPENLFSVLAILLGWPPGNDDLEVRMDISGCRIYWIRIGTKLILDLAPRYLILRQLDLIENARIKIRRFMAGQILQDGNLEADIMQILMPDGLRKHQPVLAPELGPWLVYPPMQISKTQTMNIVQDAHVPNRKPAQSDAHVPNRKPAQSDAHVPKRKPAQSAARKQMAFLKKGAKVPKKSSAGLESQSTSKTGTVRKNKKMYVPSMAVTTHEQEMTCAQVTGEQNLNDTDPETVFPYFQKDLVPSREKEDQGLNSAHDLLMEGLADAGPLTADTSLLELEISSHGFGIEQRQIHQPLLIFSRENPNTTNTLRDSLETCSEKVDLALDPKTSTASTCLEGHKSKAADPIKQIPTVPSDIRSLLYAFQQVHPGLGPEILQSWLSGQSIHNHMFSLLLDKLADLYNSTQDKEICQHIQDALEIVHKGRVQLVNKKQQKRVEGIYHSICNPDKSGGLPLSNWGTSPGQTVEVGRHSVQHKHNQPTVATISRSLSLSDHARSLLIRKMKYLPIPSVNIAIPQLASKSKLVVVSGPPMQVQQALQWAESTVLDQTPGKWGSDNTYIDSEDLSTRIRFLGVGHCQDGSHESAIEKFRPNTWSECVLQLDQALQSPKVPPFVHLTRQIFTVFDHALDKLGPNVKVEMQGRLGRVVFSHRSSEKWSMPYENSQPLENLICDLTARKVNKQRFDDSMDSMELSYLRAALGICRPKKTWRQSSIVLVVSPLNSYLTDSPTTKKFTIVESDSHPNRFEIRFVQSRRRVATADIVRLHVGAIKTDVRISMMTTEQKEMSEEDIAFVKGMDRRGAVIVFPPEHYAVHTQRLKEAEIFLFDGLKVTLTEVTQTRGCGNSRIKYEVEFEAVDPGADGSTTCFISAQLLAQRVNLLLKEMQSICTSLCLSSDRTPTKELAQKLLLHWKMHNKNSSGLWELLATAIYTDQPSSFASEDGTYATNSMVICDLMEHLHHFDDSITARDNDASNELLLAVLDLLHERNIVLAGEIRHRAELLVTSGQLHPKAALIYASLLPKLIHARAHLKDNLTSYVWQMRLEQQNEEADGLVKSLELHDETRETSLAQLMTTIPQNGFHHVFCCLRRLIYENRASQFMVLLTHALQQEFDHEARAGLQEKIKKVMCHHAARAGEFVLQCSSWFLQSTDETMLLVTATNAKAATFWLIEMIELLNVPITEECRLLTLSQLIRSAPVRSEAQDIEKIVFKTYQVDEALFRHQHYQRILQGLFLQINHKEELLRRGLTESQCQFFKTLSPGHRVQASCLIPGLNGNGDRLIGSPGIIIPARDPTGQLTGAQIKDDNPASGKYKWWSSNNQGGKGPRLGPDFPLFCCVPQEQDCSVVGLCEGGLKAHVAAALTGLPMIGAAGAAFPQSKGLLETYLAMMNPTQILFFPDAGSTCNDQVSHCYFQTFRLLRAWNYNLLVAWWGQVNKEDHHDIDDLLCSEDSMRDIPLLSVRQFWQVLHPDVRNKLSEDFLEFSEPREIKTCFEANDLGEGFTDTDGIHITRTVTSSVNNQRFLVSIPKSMIKRMPAPPNGLVTTCSVQTFSIEACMVWVTNVQETDQAIDWLMQDENQNTGIIGMDCEHGPDGALNLIQLSVHCRCVLICTPSHMSKHICPVPLRLAMLLASKTHIKTGAEVHKDALAIYHGIGLIVNGCRNISHVYRINNQTSSMLTIFRTLYGWEWEKLKSITCSDWSSVHKSLEQIKYAVLDAWASRMIALEGKASEKGAIPLVSLEDIPKDVLDLFGRAILHSTVLRKDEKVIEGAGNITAMAPGTLRLQQTKFRSRVLAPKSRVEIRFKDGQEPEHYVATARAGKSVTLHRMSTSTSSSESGKRLEIGSISSMFIDNRMHSNKQKQRLEEGLYKILCKQAQCPYHILYALKCVDVHQKEKGTLEGYASNLRSVQHISNNLNESQRNAWAEVLTSPLAATIGPPGTGKTQLIAAVTTAWSALAGQKEVILCTAYQNVATRHIAESLVRHQVPGVMLLISEDYYMEWHEELYHKLKQYLVIARSGHSDLNGELGLWEANHKRRGPRVIICTLTLVGSQAFSRSLMNGKVTMMLVDECSQAAEGSILPPLLCLPDLLQVGLLGDPYQLPPYGKQGSPTKSVYDLMSMGCNPRLLEEQYRMPPSICNFISGEFYSQRLRTAPRRQAQTDYRNPMLWIDIPGSTSVLPGKTSLSNQAEAEAITNFCREYARTMARLSSTDEGLYTEQPLRAHHDEAPRTGLVVLTLYDEQRQLISSLLQKSGLEFQVHNVDSFQGQEAETVLISLVVAERFSSFAADPHRACVLLSRARKLMCIFGNLRSVLRNPRAEVWGRLASHCHKHHWVARQTDIQIAIEGNVHASTLKTPACSVM